MRRLRPLRYTTVLVLIVLAFSLGVGIGSTSGSTTELQGRVNNNITNFSIPNVKDLFGKGAWPGNNDNLPEDEEEKTKKEEDPLEESEECDYGEDIHVLYADSDAPGGTGDGSATSPYPTILKLNDHLTRDDEVDVVCLQGEFTDSFTLTGVATEELLVRSYGEGASIENPLLTGDVFYYDGEDDGRLETLTIRDLEIIGDSEFDQLEELTFQNNIFKDGNVYLTIEDVDSLLIDSNIFNALNAASGTRGLKLSNTDHALIMNNFWMGIERALYLGDTGDVQLLGNSFSENSRGLYLEDETAANLEIKNNIFYCESGYSIAWEEDHEEDHNLDTDYNLFDCQPSRRDNSLSSWQSRGYGSNSLEGDAGFTASDDLHLDSKSSDALNAGISLSELEDDIDGDERIGKGNPDIGADEVKD